MEKASEIVDVFLDYPILNNKNKSSKVEQIQDDLNF